MEQQPRYKGIHLRVWVMKNNHIGVGGERSIHLVIKVEEIFP
jgi:hypothetical protein